MQTAAQFEPAFWRAQTKIPSELHRCRKPIDHQAESVFSGKAYQKSFVEIMTSKAEDAGPSRDWLKIATSSRARTKIRAWFTKERRDEAIGFVGEEKYRMWLLYLTGCSLAFKNGGARLYQVLVEKQAKKEASGMPPTREHLYHDNQHYSTNRRRAA